MFKNRYLSLSSIKIDDKFEAYTYQENFRLRMLNLPVHCIYFLFVRLSYNDFLLILSLLLIMALICTVQTCLHIFTETVKVGLSSTVAKGRALQNFLQEKTPFYSL